VALQQYGALVLHAEACTHLCDEVSQVSVVQALLSLQSESPLHWMQPPLAGSQVSPLAHCVLSGVCVQVPFEQVSVVHAIRSSQSVSAQHAAQPTPVQHLPLEQPAGVHFPLTQLSVVHGSLLGQSLPVVHCAVATHF
jgi:hypothetical protein